MASAFGCGQPPDFAKKLNEEQREEIEMAYQDAQVMMPVIENLWQKADPLFDAHGEPVESNEVLISDVYGVLDDLRYYIDNNQIYAVSSADLAAAGYDYVDAQGRFTDPRLEENIKNNDFILLNEDCGWSAELLMHEAAHRTDLHDEGVTEYLFLHNFELDREYGKWTVASGDWAWLQSVGFIFVGQALSDLDMTRSIVRMNIEDPKAYIENWDNVVMWFEYALNKDMKQWHHEFFEHFMLNNADTKGFFEEFGLSMTELEDVIRNEELFKYRQSEIQLEYELAKELYNEYKTELSAEHRSELNGYSRR
ncbi:MAG: hypothetical protein UX09_C0033G0014 [Candidatus Uhrbacteria bacterium GW2011_GWE2_45_35]|uniref:Uncharacterized protein n=2 Tax=Candidatus Uhriibacteriota TaxID=1752732 RepID=A0A0G1JGS7_9BACT|nr:MAG: hypothetical protein UW63_C0021G0011 [Candidatus Uhrbacteria bacterium GW2011_GWF2_44_350]KKU07221.1 MAG: hypothetical protein UX09_C0033G0014 [Candidatus Uhrbacteria bacterium GW2011_GWE2_45_35]